MPWSPPPEVALPSLRLPAFSLMLAAAPPAAAPAMAAPAPAPEALAFADLAELALAAPIVAVAQIERIERLGERVTGPLPAGAARWLVRARIGSALVAPGPLPAQVEYLWDGPAQPRPALRGARVLLFAAPVAGAPEQLRLVHRRAQALWSPESEAAARALVAEARDPALAGRRPTGVVSAFSVAGAIPGESETQIFLRTQGGEPVSLVALRRPGEALRWSVAFGDAIDEAARPPAPGTLARHFLACGLPPALPPAATAELAPADARRAAQDYAAVRAEVGACGVTLGRDDSSTATAAQSG